MLSGSDPASGIEILGILSEDSVDTGIVSGYHLPNSGGQGGRVGGYRRSMFF